MAAKRNKKGQEPARGPERDEAIKTTSDYYRLKTKAVEDLVNEQIKRDLPIVCEEVPLEEAKRRGAIGLFESKYGEKVKLYTMGDFSMEICGGPHATHTGALGHFRILKEESSSRGVRRIKAVLE